MDPTIQPVSSAGLTIRSHSGGHVVVDFLGWFTGPSAAVSTQGLFVPVGPQRLLDTRELVGLAPLRGLTVVRVDGGGHALHDSHAPELAAALLADVIPAEEAYA